ncbi:uncharacterized protein [Haliotis asinina]|uniref:uncharacterized protein n=1 Tax=Haliotis asinina TaxID=109174 RepID=UPI003531D7FB
MLRSSNNSPPPLPVPSRRPHQPTARLLSTLARNNSPYSSPKGLKFATHPTPTPHPPRHLYRQYRERTPGGKVDFLRHQISNILQKAKPQVPNLTSSDRQAIKQLKEDRDIVVVPADKGRTTVVLDRPHFHSMVGSMLQDTSTYKKLQKDPTAKLNRQHKAHLKTLCDKPIMPGQRSPILAEIYMSDLEEKALLTSPFQPMYWYRKVDDTFVVLKPDNDPLELLNHLNKQHPRVKFTMEAETNIQIPLLDILLSRNHSNQLHTTVYRKPTHTNQYVHYQSNHPPRVKSGIISTLTRRAKNVCSIKPPRPESAAIKISIPYIGKPSYQISRLLKQQAGIDTTFTTSVTINTLLQANGRKHPQAIKPNPKDVIYKTDCNCGHSYIGETSRPVDTRIKEHQKSTIKSDQKSAVSDHIAAHPDHQINWTDYTILSKNQSDFTKRKITEAINIKRYRPLIHRDQGYPIPTAYDELIKPL